VLNECLEIARRQLPETHGRAPVGGKLQKLSDGAEVVCDGAGGKPAECRQVLLISRELLWNVWRRLARKKTALFKIRSEDARHGGQIGIVVRISGGTDLKIGATDRREGAETAAEPPLLQSTSSAQMSPHRDLRIAMILQPACKATQERPEQP
jgi:hypothetical protein